MNKERTPRAGTAVVTRRKPRRRAMPKWLANSEGLDAIARSRCLMVLSVLSGEKTVSDVIAETRISRGTYYQLETRALSAMLTGLNPLGPASQKDALELSQAQARIEALQGRVEQLEQDKRRTQRLLLLTRKSIRAPVTTGRRGRAPKSALLGLTPSGRTRSPRSRTKAASGSASIPTKAGESAP